MRHAGLPRLRQFCLSVAAEECERLYMTVAEGFRCLGRISHHEVGVRMRQIVREGVDLALDAADCLSGLPRKQKANDRQSLADVGLRVPRRMRQRHEHLG